MENKDKETISLKGIIVRYLRLWKFFLVVFLISFIPAILYLKFYPVTYEFASSIQIQEDKESSMASFGLGEAAGLMKSFGIGSGGGTINMDDEMALMSSNKVLRMMILDLGLNVSYSHPYSFYKLYEDAPLKLTTYPSTMEHLDDEYRFTVSVSPGNIKVKAVSRLGGYNETLTYTSLPAKIKIADDEFTLDYNRDVPSEESFKLKIRCTPASWLAEDLSKSIEIEEVSNTSYVLDLTYSDHSKKRGKDVLNTLLNKYNEDVASFKRIEDNKTMTFVDGRITNVLNDLSRVELDLQEYKTRNEMTLPESDVVMYGELMLSLQASIIEVESQSRIIDMIDEYIKNPDNKYNVIPSMITAADGEKGGTISKYNEAIVERDKLLKNSNESNFTFRMIDNQVEKLREGVYAMIENSKKNYNKTLEGLNAKEQQILSKMKTFPEKEREYIGYRRDQEILQGIYLMLLQKREETVLSLGKQTDRARIIEPAYIKKKPLGPRKLFAAIGMLVFTLVIPIGYLFAKDLFVSIKEEYKSSES